jgi:hypothetical protein
MLALWPSIVTNLFFIGVQEYSIWTSGVSEEIFRHIGQWGVLVGTVLVLGAAVLPGLITKVYSKLCSTRCSQDGSPGTELVA